MDEYAETLKDGIIIVEYISFLMFPLHFYVKYSYKVLGIRISFNSDLFIIVPKYIFCKQMLIIKFLLIVYLSLFILKIRAGTPATTAFGGTSFITTAPAPINDSSPNSLTPVIIVALIPI